MEQTLSNELSKYKVGYAAKKDNCTHHGEGPNGFTYYSVPTLALGHVATVSIQAFMINRPFSLSEHAPVVSRLFLDLDCNKHGKEDFTHTDLHEFMMVLQPQIEKHFPKPLVTTLQDQIYSPDNITARRPYAWICADTYDSTAQGFFDPETGQGLSAEEYKAKQVDPYLCWVLKSPVSETHSTYHLIWSFIVMDRRLALERFKTIFKEPHLQSLIPRVKPDLNLLLRGSLRGYLQGKANGERPFIVGDIFDSVGTAIDLSWVGTHTERTEELSHMTVWLATSLLYGSRVESTPTIPVLLRQIRDHATPRPSQNQSVEEMKDRWRTEFGYSQQIFSAVDLNTVMQGAKDDVLEKNPRATYEDISDNVTLCVVDYLNGFFAYIQGRSKTTILYKSINSAGDIEYISKGQEAVKDQMNAGGIITWLQGEKVKKLNAWNLWSTSPVRLTYIDTIVENPAKKPHPDFFNLFRGYRLKPEDCEAYKDYELNEEYTKTGMKINVQKVLDHIHTFFCSKNDEHFSYLISWLAFILQNPCEKNCSTIVMDSQEGIGKDLILSEAIGYGIIGERHFLQTSSGEALLGRFNTSLESKVFVVYAEADQVNLEQMSKLKNLTTEKRMVVERKFMDACNVKSCVNVCLCTNNQHAHNFNVGPHARRWFWLSCDSSINTSRNYFDDLAAFLGVESGDFSGTKALGWYLYNIDLAGYKSRVVPLTDALVDQKRDSLHPVHQWWLGCLSRIEIPMAMGMDFSDQEMPTGDWEAGDITVARRYLRESFLDYANHNKVKPPGEARFWTFLRQIVELKASGQVRAGLERPRIIHLSKIAVCRVQFKHFVRGYTFKDEAVPVNETGVIDAYTEPKPVWGEHPPQPVRASSSSQLASSPSLSQLSNLPSFFTPTHSQEEDPDEP
jgi:hypothetical protein